VSRISSGITQSLPPPSLRDVWRVCRDYYSSHRRFPNLLRPRRFSEKMQWRKLFDSNPAYPLILDKISARHFIASRVGEGRLPQLLWVGEDPADIPFGELDPPYVLKCNHGSGFNIIVPDRRSLNVEQARTKLRSFLSQSYGAPLREPGYLPIEPRVLVERLMLEEDGTPPREYKLFAFDGRTQVVWGVHVDRSRARFDAVYDLDWRCLNWRACNPAHSGRFERPAQFDEMLSIANCLSAGFDHLRVDLYVWQGQVRIGELTVYNLGGLVPIHPDEADYILGSMWRLRHPARRAVARMRGRRTAAEHAGSVV